MHLPFAHALHNVDYYYITLVQTLIHLTPAMCAVYYLEYGAAMCHCQLLSRAQNVQNYLLQCHMFCIT